MTFQFAKSSCCLFRYHFKFPHHLEIFEYKYTLLLNRLGAYAVYTYLISQFRLTLGKQLSIVYMKLNTVIIRQKVVSISDFFLLPFLDGVFCLPSLFVVFSHDNCVLITVSLLIFLRRFIFMRYQIVVLIKWQIYLHQNNKKKSAVCTIYFQTQNVSN